VKDFSEVINETVCKTGVSVLRISKLLKRRNLRHPKVSIGDKCQQVFQRL